VALQQNNAPNTLVYDHSLLVDVTARACRLREKVS